MLQIKWKLRLWQWFSKSALLPVSPPKCTQNSLRAFLMSWKGHNPHFLETLTKGCKSGWSRTKYSFASIVKNNCTTSFSWRVSLVGHVWKSELNVFNSELDPKPRLRGEMLYGLRHYYWHLASASEAMFGMRHESSPLLKCFVFTAIHVHTVCVSQHTWSLNFKGNLKESYGVGC